MAFSGNNVKYLVVVWCGSGSVQSQIAVSVMDIENNTMCAEISGFVFAGFMLADKARMSDYGEKE